MKPLAALSVALLLIRLYAAQVVGYGDSEALYAVWADHPQPAYLDHPGLVGLVARAIGQGTVPSPERAHLVTALLATLVPWAVVFAARALGAARERALTAGLVVAVVPEIAVGLFALTPDLLLAPLWIGALALAGRGLSEAPGSSRAAAALLGAGLLAGVSVAAKISGALLWLALLVTYGHLALSSGKGRAAARTVWPWAGLAAGAIVVVPIALWEARFGFPMLRHRLVDTQGGAGIALRNLGALLLGQLLYLSPLVAFLAYRAARALIAGRATSVTSRLLFYAFAVPVAPLVLLSAWSPVAEPHWIAPALLALPLHAARDARRLAPKRLTFAAVAMAAVFTLAAHAYVLVPAAARLAPSGSDPKLDIASELYGWPTVRDAVREQMGSVGTPFDPEGDEVAVVGPHWTVCAQLHAALPGVRVGCATEIPDDFDRWMPRYVWREADHVLFVTDNRFGGTGADQLPEHVPLAQSRVRIYRGGRVARTFELYLYARRGSALR
jgi:hypothetical protein